jgi:hypothetical protein
MSSDLSIAYVALLRPSLPGLTRQSMRSLSLSRPLVDARIKPGHDDVEA